MRSPWFPRSGAACSRCRPTSSPSPSRVSEADIQDLRAAARAHPLAGAGDGRGLVSGSASRPPAAKSVPLGGTLRLATCGEAVSTRCRSTARSWTDWASISCTCVSTSGRAAPGPDSRLARIGPGVPRPRRTLSPIRPPAEDGSSDAFDVVLPSLPGFGFSDKPSAPGWGVSRIAQTWAELMRRLGYDRYAAAGSDWGTSVSATLADQDPAHVVGAHLMPPARRAGPVHLRDPHGRRTNEPRIDGAACPP